MSTKNLVLSIAALSFIAAPALAAPAYPDKAYEATVDNVGTNTSSHTYNDGKGHMRSETVVAGVKRASILDFLNKVMYSIDDQNKTIMKMPFNGRPEDDTTANWQSIGNKVIDGHPCTGKRGTTNGTTTEVWTGTDTGCSVLVTSNGKPVSKLISYKGGPVNPALFQLPAGYKTTDMSAMMKNLQAGTKH